MRLQERKRDKLCTYPLLFKSERLVLIMLNLKFAKPPPNFPSKHCIFTYLLMMSRRDLNIKINESQKLLEFLHLLLMFGNLIFNTM